jgi:hypothetical protein
MSCWFDSQSYTTTHKGVKSIGLPGFHVQGQYGVSVSSSSLILPTAGRVQLNNGPHGSHFAAGRKPLDSRNAAALRQFGFQVPPET